jgi:hypothetical protein
MRLFRLARAGHTAGAVMLAVSIGAIVLFAAAQVSITHLQIVNKTTQAQVCKNLAESGIAYGLQDILKNGSCSGVLPAEVTEGYPEFSTVTLQARDNLNGTTTVLGLEQRSVPRNCMQLVSTARSGGQQHQVEVLYYRPPFPKALMASGKVKVTSSLKVSALDPSVTYPSDTGTIPTDNRKPASLGSNSDSRDPARPAVYLGPGTNITGDVGAVGSISLDPTALVGGEVRNGDEPQPIPDLDLDQLLTLASPPQGTTMVSGSTGPLTVDYYTGSTGSLTIGGDLTLKDEGVLWVNGDLTIEGGIKGKGLILCGGNTTVNGGADLSAKNLIALASKGDVKLTGQDKSSYFFQGLIYSEGNVSASNVTVLGSVVVNSPPGSGDMTLENVDFIQAPISGTQNFGFKIVTQWSGGGPDPNYTMAFHLVAGSRPGAPVYDWVINIDGNLYVYRNYTPAMIMQYVEGDEDFLAEDMPNDAYGRDFPNSVRHDNGTAEVLAQNSAKINNPQPADCLNLDFRSKVLSASQQSRILSWRDL